MSLSNLVYQPTQQQNAVAKKGIFNNLSNNQTVYSTSNINLSATNTNNKQMLVTTEPEEEIKIQIYYAGLITVIYLNAFESQKNSENEPNQTTSNQRAAFELENFFQKIREICKLDAQQPFTVKWVDEEGDPITLSAQMELDEAIRLYHINKESELVIHVFANRPVKPGTQCVGEDRSIYRRGARRWRKIYLVNGHRYQAKRFARTALCKVCQDRIWGLGRQGYKCLECKIMVHKRCHKFIVSPCSHSPLDLNSSNASSLNTNNNNNRLNDSASSALNTSSGGVRPPMMSSQTMSAIASSQKANEESLRSSLHRLQKQNSLPRQQKATKLDSSKTSSPSEQLTNNKASILSHQRGASSGSFASAQKYNEQQVEKNGNRNDDDESDEDLNDYDDLVVVGKTKNKHLFKKQQIDAAAAKQPQQNSRVSSNKRTMDLDDFNLIRVIGRGSYAKVFLVEYKKNDKLYAMKVIKKSMVNDDEDIDWVQTEKHVFEQATNHPFLVGLHSCFQTDSRLFFVIEYLCGGDLMYHMQRKRRLPEDHARFYAAEIALALDFLHSKGIIYRDLKLDNVLLDIEGHIKLTDYGMCKENLKRGETTNTFCGTPNYIAPEMLRGESYDYAVDWWALGVLSYEMMAGRSPFEINENPSENPDLNTEDHLFQVILEKPIRIPRNLSVKAASVLKGFLQKAPSDRLGAREGLVEIEQHPFFKAIDWKALEAKLIPPPYKPQVQDERDLSNIDQLFTKEPVVLTPDSPQTLARIQQNEFEGFEYINPLILSEDLSV